MAEEATRDRMVGDEGKESWGEGRMERSLSTQGIAGQVEALTWNERGPRVGLQQGGDAQNSEKVEAGLYLLKKLVPSR